MGHIMKYTKKQISAAFESLKKRSENHGLETVGVVITSVSRSGMSRRMRFYAPDFQEITSEIATVEGLPCNENGMRVDGGGMDMIFHVLSNLNYAMARHDHPGLTVQEIQKKVGYSNYYADYVVNADKYRRLG